MEARTVIYKALHLGKSTGRSVLVTPRSDLAVDDFVLYDGRILDNEDLLREFRVKLAGSQATKPSPEADIAEWFDRIHSERTPQKGETASHVDLDEVRRYHLALNIVRRDSAQNAK
jgi:hypothetical protein